MAQRQKSRHKLPLHCLSYQAPPGFPTQPAPKRRRNPRNLLHPRTYNFIVIKNPLRQSSHQGVGNRSASVPEWRILYIRRREPALFQQTDEHYWQLWGSDKVDSIVDVHVVREDRKRVLLQCLLLVWPYWHSWLERYGHEGAVWAGVGN